MPFVHTSLYDYIHASHDYFNYAGEIHTYDPPDYPPRLICLITAWDGHQGRSGLLLVFATSNIVGSVSHLRPNLAHDALSLASSRIMVLLSQHRRPASDGAHRAY